MYFLLLSEVLPDPNKTGGQIVLYRHLVERKFMNFQVIDSRQIIARRKWKKLISAFFHRLEKTRLHSYVIIFKPLYDLFDFDDAMIENYSHDKPAFILTVAHGRGGCRALKLAQHLNVPLVTIFHDYYPYSIISNKIFRLFWTWETQRLYRSSKLVFVITEAMQKRLGNHPNAHILAPIPSDFMANSPKSSTANVDGKNIILYAGLCGGAYLTMLHHMIRAVDSIPACEFHMVGADSALFNNRADDHLVVHGFVEEERLNQLLTNAGFLLVLIPFSHAREHFSTHFPSKLIEYAKYRKPIIIWGPSYSTAACWGIENHSAIVITQNDQKVLKETIVKIFSDPELQQKVSYNAYRYFEENWHPDLIHRIFTTKIMQLTTKTVEKD